MPETFGNLRGLAKARAVVARLYAADGCAWHREQTHTSLTRFLIEETAETVDAIERRLSPDTVCEELGDVLYQVLLHAEIADVAGEGYDLDTVAERLAEKLIARHPHVFGDMPAKTSAELKQIWQELKAAARPGGEKAATGDIFSGIPVGMPTLARAAKMVDRIETAAPGSSETFFSPEVAGGVSYPVENVEQAQQRFGAELLRLVVRAKRQGVDPDAALRQVLQQVTDSVAQNSQSGAAVQQSMAE